MEQKDHLLSNSTYSMLKGLVQLGLPAFATFYAAMSSLLDWPNAEAVLVTCAALATILGILLFVSTASWNTSAAKYDGTLAITGVDPDTGMPNLELNINKDPITLVDKRTIRLKSIDNDYFAA